jgi:hypothetical protein
MEFGRIILDHNNVKLYRPSKKNAVTDKQLKYLHFLFFKKNIGFPFESDQEAKSKLSKYDASMMIDALLEGKKIKIYHH